jgi:hypothetical protein
LNWNSGGNTNVSFQFDYTALVTQYNLLDLFSAKLSLEAAEDDLVLQVIMLVGTVLQDDDCARMVADSGIVAKIVDLLKALQEDDEIVLQVLCLAVLSD